MLLFRIFKSHERKKTIQLSGKKPKTRSIIFMTDVLKESKWRVCVSFYQLFVKFTDFTTLFFSVFLYADIWRNL